MVLRDRAKRNQKTLFVMKGVDGFYRYCFNSFIISIIGFSTSKGLPKIYIDYLIIQLQGEYHVFQAMFNL